MNTVLGEKEQLSPEQLVRCEHQIPALQRHIGWDFVIDANRINARGKLPHMVQLEKWAANGVIRIVISYEAYYEAAAGSGQRREKASGYIRNKTHITANDEIRLKNAIERILYADGARTQNQENDVRIVFNAAKYLDILITDDGASNTQPDGILGNRDKLQALHPTIKIMRDSEAVEFVRERIRVRDEQLHLLALEFPGSSIPAWCGKD